MSVVERDKKEDTWYMSYLNELGRQKKATELDTFFVSISSHIQIEDERVKNPS